MQRSIGTKQVNLKPMTRQQYNDFRGWKLPDDEDGSDEGYLVEYTDGGKPNHPDYAGYISWSPKEQAEKAYQPVAAMNFSHAHLMAIDGFKIARKGWNDKGQFVVVIPSLYLPPYNTQGTERKVNDRTAKWIGEDSPLDSQPYYSLKTADGKWQPGWAPSQGDLFANDWTIVD